MILLRGILGDFSQCSKIMFPEAVKNRHTLSCKHALGCCDSLVVDEGIFIDGLYDELERYLGGQGVAMLDHWFSVGTIPTVHCRKVKTPGEMMREQNANVACK